MSDIRAFGMALVLRAIREALAAHVRPEAREAIIAEALSRFDGEVSAQGETLRLFLAGPLWDAVSRAVGRDVADALTEELCEVLKDRFATDGGGSLRHTPSPMSLDRKGVEPTFGDRLVVLLASPCVETKLALKEALREENGALVDVLDAHEAVAWAEHYRIKAPVVVVDCRRRVRDVEPLRTGLVDGSVVVLWGDKAPRPPPTPGLTWQICPGSTSPEELSSLITALRYAA